MRYVYNKRSGDAPKGAVYIGRGSKWGNPFKIGPDGSRKLVIEKHAQWLKTREDLLGAIGELTGKPLICYCAPDACHGDLLAQLANDPDFLENFLK